MKRSLRVCVCIEVYCGSVVCSVVFSAAVGYTILTVPLIESP